MMLLAVILMIVSTIMDIGSTANFTMRMTDKTLVLLLTTVINTSTLMKVL